MPPLRVALVGAGTALHAMYGPAFRFLEGARLVCVMDPWAEARRRAARDYKIKAYATLRGMIAHGRPDVAIVASPTWAHAEQVLRLAGAGIHVFCEKPMARSPEECSAMIAACEEAGVALGLGFMKRGNLSFAIAGDYLRRRRLGPLFELDCEWSFPAGHGPERYAHPHTDWRGHLENWGGVFQDHGSHTVDLARLWLGEVRQVSAQLRILNPRQHVEDVAAVTCRHAGGAISTHRMNLRTHRPLIERYEVFGRRGTLELEWGGVWRWSAYTAEPMNVRVYRRGREVIDLTPRPEQAIELEMGRHWHYLTELRAFLHALRQGRPPPATGADGRAAVEVITAAYLSAATGQTIHLPLRERVDLEAIFSSGVLRR
jgi:myo-inositol 2-dehydrogenase/D-chiro-inositol 1-dehydrogenase